MKFLERLVGHYDDGIDDQLTDVAGVATAISASIIAENKHVENRFQWNLGLQGFLFASYAISLNSQTDKNGGVEFADVVANAGMVSCLITLLGLWAAYRSINFCKIRWMRNDQILSGISHRPFSDPFPSMLGRLPSTFITAAILYSWFRISTGVGIFKIVLGVAQCLAS